MDAILEEYIQACLFQARLKKETAQRKQAERERAEAEQRDKFWLDVRGHVEKLLPEQLHPYLKLPTDAPPYWYPDVEIKLPNAAPIEFRVRLLVTALGDISGCVMAGWISVPGVSWSWPNPCNRGVVEYAWGIEQSIHSDWPDAIAAAITQGEIFAAKQREIELERERLVEELKTRAARERRQKPFRTIGYFFVHFWKHFFNGHFPSASEIENQCDAKLERKNHEISHERSDL